MDSSRDNALLHQDWSKWQWESITWKFLKFKVCSPQLARRKQENKRLRVDPPTALPVMLPLAAALPVGLLATAFPGGLPTAALPVTPPPSAAPLDMPPATALPVALAAAFQVWLLAAALQVWAPAAGLTALQRQRRGQHENRWRHKREARASVGGGGCTAPSRKQKRPKPSSGSTSAASGQQRNGKEITPWGPLANFFPKNPWEGFVFVFFSPKTVLTPPTALLQSFQVDHQVRLQRHQQGYSRRQWHQQAGSDG